MQIQKWGFVLDLVKRKTFYSKSYDRWNEKRVFIWKYFEKRLKTKREKNEMKRKRVLGQIKRRYHCKGSIVFKSKFCEMRILVSRKY